MTYTIEISQKDLLLISKMYHNIDKSIFTNNELEDIQILCEVMEDIANGNSHHGNITKDMIINVSEF